MDGIVIAGTASGVGKTVTTLAVARALSEIGYDPVPAKAGPDYIDPSHHAAAIHRTSRTLDTWMQGVEGVRRNAHRAAMPPTDTDAKTFGDTPRAKCPTHQTNLDRSATSKSSEGLKNSESSDNPENTEYPENPIIVVEGMMGLYDGSVTSTAATAAALAVPVILVVDAAAGMQSVGATALGFQQYATHTELPPDVTCAVKDAQIDVVGVIAARAHPGTHADGIEESIPEGIEWLGYVPPIADLEIPDRHLGLHMDTEAAIPTDAITKAAEEINGEAIATLAEPVATSSDHPVGTDHSHPAQTDHSHPAQTDHSHPKQAIRRTKPVQDRAARESPRCPTIAVATGEAFRFIYPATMERLRELATVTTFAPTAGEDLPDCDGLYLPGGYPELHAAELERSPACETIAERAAEGLPILGECGGLMVLTESLTTTDGETYEMAGILPGRVTMHERYQALDHVELVASRDTVTATAGDRHRGHEFHYSAHIFPNRETVDVDSDARFAFEVTRGYGIDGDHDGLYVHRTVGTYTHRHPESGAFDHLVEAARDYGTGP